MIAYIKGKLEEIQLSSVILDVGGIGYEISVPASALSSLQLQKNKEVKLYTYLQIKEDGMSLFGFLNLDDLQLFQKLITVNGIGPKGALSILSTLSANELRLAVASGDSKAIAKSHGIGKKIAEKIVLELKDKVSVSGIFESDRINAAVQPAESEVVEALISLGISSSDANRAVHGVQHTENMSAEEILHLALKNL